jgi:hypothetical protein
MSLLLYLAVLLVSVTGVIFGMDWLAAPAPHYRPPPVVTARVDGPPPVAHLGSDAAARQINPPSTLGKSGPTGSAEPLKNQARVAPASPVASANPPTSAPPAQDEAPPGVMAAAELPKCDVRACEAAYISFRVADCTYQPSSGPRRLCEKGNPPRAAAVASDPEAQASAAPSSCNVQACQRAYFTFDPVDCTYQPSQGPRRLCTKR